MSNLLKDSRAVSFQSSWVELSDFTKTTVTYPAGTPDGRQAGDAAAGGIDSERQAAPQAVSQREMVARIREAAWTAGYQDGYEAGYAKSVRRAQGRLRRALTELQETARNLARERDQLLQSVSEGVLDLAAAISRQILAGEIDQSPERLLPMLVRARAWCENDSDLELHLHPDDLERLQADGDDATPAVAADVSAAFPDCRFVADRSLNRGDFVVKSNRGTIDLRMDAQIEALLSHLRGGDGHGLS
ncbi:MAG: FliH/SctL family protein [Thermaerobacterales bacterium]